MISLFDQLKFTTVAIAFAITLGACGGGDADTAVAPTPAPEVFITPVNTCTPPQSPCPTPFKRPRWP